MKMKTLPIITHASCLSGLSSSRVASCEELRWNPEGFPESFSWLILSSG